MRVILNKDKFNVEEIKNLHRFGMGGITKTDAGRFTTTLNVMEFLEHMKISSVIRLTPAYPLNITDNTISWNLEEPTDSSYDFFVEFKPTCFGNRLLLSIQSVVKSNYISQVISVNV